MSKVRKSKVRKSKKVVTKAKDWTFDFQTWDSGRFSSDVIANEGDEGARES